MEFKLSKSQKKIQKAASDFAKGEFDKEQAMEMDRNRVFPKELYEKASELGFIGIHFDEAYLGGGLSFLDNVLMAETLCRKDATMGGALMLAGYGAECLLRFGTRELKEAFIPSVAEGKMLAWPKHIFVFRALRSCPWLRKAGPALKKLRVARISGW